MGGLGFVSCISAPDGLIRTGMDHGNETVDENIMMMPSVGWVGPSD